ncbi:ferritin family protein [Candidatus Bathyarchaeota archaeon]|nr:ferritin family protein [Candidatus Bathyarchaeota archaeon]
MSVDEWTIEKALQTGIIMEEGAYQLYTNTGKKVVSPGSKQMLKELAADELMHKEYFEKALKDPKKVLDTSKIQDLKKLVKDLGVTDPLKEADLKSDATYQEILIFAAKSEKLAYEFYSALAKQFKGHPLSAMWDNFAQMELGHKLKLEKEYEDVILKDN